MDLWSEANLNPRAIQKKRIFCQGNYEFEPVLKVSVMITRS